MANTPPLFLAIPTHVLKLTAELLNYVIIDIQIDNFTYKAQSINLRQTTISSVAAFSKITNKARFFIQDILSTVSPDVPLKKAEFKYKEKKLHHDFYKGPPVTTQNKSLKWFTQVRWGYLYFYKCRHN